MPSLCWIILLLSVLSQSAHAHISLGTSKPDPDFHGVFVDGSFLSDNTTGAPNIRRQGPAPAGAPDGWFRLEQMQALDLAYIQYPATGEILASSLLHSTNVCPWLNQRNSNAGRTTGPLVGINFPQYCHERDRIINTGFPQALQLARAALQYMQGIDDDGNPDPRSAGQESYYRYFAEESREVVFDVLQSLFVGHPKDGVASSDLDRVTFSMDPPLGDLSHVCRGQMFDSCSDEYELGLTVNGCSGMSGVPKDAGIGYAIITICRTTFIGKADLSDWIPKAPFIPFPRCTLFKNGKNYAQQVERGQKGMMALAGTIFHELLHFHYLFGRSKLDLFGQGKPILDYWAKDDKTNSAQQPENGYGPWGTFQLREVSKSDPGMDVRTPQWNSDSYTWFALEAFWGRICNIKFIDPPDDATTIVPDAQTPEPYKPPGVL